VRTDPRFGCKLVGLNEPIFNGILGSGGGT